MSLRLFGTRALFRALKLKKRCPTTSVTGVSLHIKLYSAIAWLEPYANATCNMKPKPPVTCSSCVLYTRAVPEEYVARFSEYNTNTPVWQSKMHVLQQLHVQLSEVDLFERSFEQIRYLVSRSRRRIEPKWKPNMRAHAWSTTEEWSHTGQKKRKLHARPGERYPMRRYLNSSACLAV